MKQCRNGGIDCKIHGLQVVGRKRSEDEDYATTVSFLASDAEDCCDHHDTPVPGAYGGGARPRSAMDHSKRNELHMTKVFVWGLNDKDQLGGLKGSKIKLPIYSDTLSNLKPIHIAGECFRLFILMELRMVEQSLCSFLTRWFQVPVCGYVRRTGLCLWRGHKWPPWSVSQQQCVCSASNHSSWAVCCQESSCTLRRYV